jgi:hypothetical protein
MWGEVLGTGQTESGRSARRHARRSRGYSALLRSRGQTKFASAPSPSPLHSPYTNIAWPARPCSTCVTARRGERFADVVHGRLGSCELGQLVRERVAVVARARPRAAPSGRATAIRATVRLTASLQVLRSRGETASVRGAPRRRRGVRTDDGHRSGGSLPHAIARHALAHAVCERDVVSVRRRTSRR